MISWITPANIDTAAELLEVGKEFMSEFFGSSLGKTVFALEGNRLARGVLARNGRDEPTAACLLYTSRESVEIYSINGTDDGVSEITKWIGMKLLGGQREVATAIVDEDWIELQLTLSQAGWIGSTIQMEIQGENPAGPIRKEDFINFVLRKEWCVDELEAERVTG